MALSDNARDELAMKVLERAVKKARRHNSGDVIKVTVKPNEIPAGAHYGEIVGTLEFNANKYGLKAVIGSSWTYSFTKL
jgi:hypothetical protein